MICELAGVLGSIYTTPSVDTWYAGLIKPLYNPPGWLFAPVWTILFALMGVSLFLVWKRGWKQRTVRIATIIFFVQLIFNVVWSVLFFGLHNPGAALVEIIFLWFAILTTILSFSKITKVAAWLLVPYLAWVTFASYLTYSFWLLNK